MRVFFLTTIIFLNPVYIFSQGFPFIQNYDVEEFGAFRQVWDFAQDSNGVMYIANGTGILVHDGVRWTNHHIPKTNHILALLKNSDGTIYYAGENEIGYLANDSLNHFKSISLTNDIVDSISFGDIYRIHELNGKIYFETKNGFAIVKDERVEFIDTNFEIKSSFVVDNQLYIYSKQGALFLYSNETIAPIDIPFNSLDDYVIHLKEVNDGFQIFTRNEGIIFQNNTYLESIDSTNYGQLFNREILSDNGFAIASMDSGVYLFDKNWTFEERYYSTNSSEGLINQVAYNTFEDNERNLWVATLNGISKISTDLPLRFFGEPSGIEGEILDIEYLDSTIYVATYTGLFQSNKNIDYPTFRKLSTSGTLDLFVNDSLLFVADEFALRLYQNHEFNKVIKSGLSRAVVAFKEGENNHVYVANTGQLFELIYNHNFSKLLSENVIHVGTVTELVYHNDWLWFKDHTEGILNYSLNNKVTSKFSIEGVLPSQISHLGIINEEIYAGTEFGLFVYDSELTVFNKIDGFFPSALKEKQVFYFNQTSKDTVWFVNDRKLSRLINDDGKYNTLTSPYQILQNRNTISTITKIEESIWLGASSYLVKVDPSDWSYKTDFKTNITGTFVNQDSLIYGGFGEPPNEIILPFIDNALRFTYAAASYIDTDRNRYSYKLEGFDENWSDFSLETQKDYTNIPEGEYVFKVKSKNVFGVEGSTDSFAFTVLPPWYRTWWAYLLYMIGFSGLMYTAHRIRLNQLLKVERMRTKIASDLHDEVSATLTGISYFAEAVKTDRDEARKSHFINLITESAGDAKEKITDIVWSITPENDDWTLFFSKCRRYASDILESADMEYNLNITDTIHSELSMNVRQHLWMIFKEMLTNAVRHSKATQLDIIFDVDNGVLKLIVQDNGQGFDIDADQMGNGVTNIKKRANAIGAKIYFNSEPEMGTRWRLEYNI
jgi:ligand-binding sensor domain-containing protein